MTNGVIHVTRPGLHSTIQDLGRWGFQSQGVPVAGPMDLFSHRLANALVGNARTAATLEIALVGPELEFDDERLVVVTGAEFALTLDNTAVPTHRPFVVGPRARLSFGARTSGARAYVGIEGGLDVPLVLGSRSTHVPSGVGGWQGRAIARGDRVPLGPSNPARAALEARGRRFVRSRTTPGVVRVLAGPDTDRFAPDALDALQSGSYVVGRDSDRMGFRLNGPALRHSRGADMISDATPVGSLQVPGSGQPVLLMADRQTTGGYPKIATVISADVGTAAQIMPGDHLSFHVCTPADAIAALIASERVLLALESVG